MPVNGNYVSPGAHSAVDALMSEQVVVLFTYLVLAVFIGFEVISHSGAMVECQWETRTLLVSGSPPISPSLARKRYPSSCSRVKWTGVGGYILLAGIFGK